MALTENDIEQVNELVSGVLNRKAWGVSMGHGTFVTMEFGAPVPVEPSRKEHGQWHLWICSVAWRLEHQGEPLVGFDDDGDMLSQSLSMLEGRELDSIEISPPAGDTILRFRGGFVLRLFIINILGDEIQWMLYTPGGVLTIGEGHHWSFEKVGD